MIAKRRVQSSSIPVSVQERTFTCRVSHSRIKTMNVVQAVSGVDHGRARSILFFLMREMK